MERYLVSIMLLALICLCNAGFSVTYYVKKDGNDKKSGLSWDEAFLTITKAADEVTSGDAVWVAEGKYKEGDMLRVDEGVSIYGGFLGNEEELSQRTYQEHETIIDGEKTYRCVVSEGTMDGFHIVNGLGIANTGILKNCFVYDNTSRFSDGGGVTNTGSMMNCEIYNNEAHQNGGGIYNNGSVSNCDIYDNYADDDGGGIYNRRGGIIVDCSVHNNITRVDGGGIYNNYGIVNACRVYKNVAEFKSGGAIFNYGDVKNCNIFSNTADDAGGGVFNNGSVINCIMYSNIANHGGGIFNIKECAVVNCTIYKNSAKDSGGGIIGNGIVQNCISWNNERGDIVRIFSLSVTNSCFGEAENEMNNIRGNPLFVNTLGDLSTWDLHLKNGSPCIDMGNVDESPQIDIEGKMRPGGDEKVCIGAYESPSDYVPDEPQYPVKLYVSKEGNNSDGSSWRNAYTSIKKAIFSLDDKLYEIWVAEGSYNNDETIFIPGRVISFGGFLGVEDSISQRDIEDNKTIIYGEDCQCIYNCGILDGFYVTNGSSKDEGGGINNFGVVRFCTVYDNKADEGGGILNMGYVNNCNIYNNYAHGENGGGISNYGTVSTCEIYNNITDDHGGGIDNSGMVTDTHVYDNTSGRNGGAIFNVNKESIISDCKIKNNFAEEYGGGIYNSRGTVRNCIMHENSSMKGGAISNLHGRVENTIAYLNSSEYGGGIYNEGDGVVVNCTVYRNSAEYIGGGIYNTVDEFYSLSGMVTNCISWNNFHGDIHGVLNDVSFCCYGQADDNNHNFRADPLFVNTSGDISSWDFRLKNSSPCIDTGNLGLSPEMDICENPRPGEDKKVCLGAYESPSDYIAEPPQSPRKIYVSKNGDNSDASSWGQAFTTIKRAISMISDEDALYEIWINEGLYGEGEEITVPGRVTLYGGFSGTESELSQRDVKCSP